MRRGSRARGRAINVIVVALVCAAPSVAHAAPGDISTIAGSYRSDHAPARSVALGWPVDVATDASGNLYIADAFSARVRRVDVLTGEMTTAAGNGTYAFAGDGGPARDASIREPNGVAIDTEGNLLFSDRATNRVQRVNAATGVVNTIAGNGADKGTLSSPCVSAGDGLPATKAGVCAPAGLTVDDDGNIFIAEGTKIRRIDAETGVISTVAGGNVPGYTSVGITSSVAIPLADVGDGKPATLARLYVANDVAVDHAGNLYIAEVARIRKVDAATGIISTVAGTGECGSSPDGGAAAASAICNPSSVTIDPTGVVVFSDTNRNKVRRIDPATGILSTIAGDGTAGFGGDGSPAAGPFSYPAGLAYGSGGTLFIASPYRALVASVDMVAQTFSVVAGGAWCSASADGGPATSSALCGPAGMTHDPAGNLVFADFGANLVRRIDHVTGSLSTLAGNGTYNGDLGDGGPATSATLDGPVDVAFDAAGNLFISDKFHERIRKVDAVSGVISTAAGGGSGFGYTGDGGPATSASLWSPEGIEIGPDGSLYIADALNMRIRRVDLIAGIITTVAGGGPQTIATDQVGLCPEAPTGDGGPATLADLCGPNDVVFDHAGNMLIADSSHDRVRKVDASTGFISTIAGRSVGHVGGYSGDGGPATNAELYFVVGLAVDSADNIYAVDYYNRRVRRIDAATGIISTVAGNGGQEYRGDGVPATSAGMGPSWLVVAPDDALLISDAANGRIRRVEP